MVGQLAREFEGRVQFVTSPGLADSDEHAEAVKDFGWPDYMVHAVDTKGDLWRHLDVIYRGAWLFIDDDGTVSSRSVTHIPKAKVKESLEKLVAS